MKKIIHFTCYFLSACVLLCAVTPRWQAGLNTEYNGSAAWYKGRIVLTLRSGQVVCLAGNGLVQWTKVLKNPVFAPPVVDARGNIFIACADGLVLCLDLQCRQIFETALSEPVQAAPIVFSDGVIVIGQKGTLFYLDRKKGLLSWKKELKMPVFTSAVCDRHRGRIYVAVEDFYLVCLDTRGNILWKHKTIGVNHVAPALSRTGDVYLCSMDHHLYKFSPEGELAWQFATDRWIRSAPVIDGSGNVYFGGYDRHMYSVGPDGKLRWKYEALASINSTAAIDDKGHIYFGDTSGTVYALDQAGNLLWKFKSKDFVQSGFAITPGKGLLIMGNIAGEVLAFDVPAGLSRKAMWPKLLGDERNSCFSD